MNETAVFLVAAVAGSIASVTGFGIGSLLTPLLAVTIGTARGGGGVGASPYRHGGSLLAPAHAT